MQPDDENQKAKVKFIAAFFDDLGRKINFLDELKKTQHRDEAFLLCCCYIDWLASGLWWADNRGSNFRFVRVLKEFGEEQVLSLIHPQQLEDALGALNSKLVKAMLQKIVPILQEAGGMLYGDNEMIELLRPALTTQEMERLKNELWRGTVAAIVYSWIRSPAVHGFGSQDGISFNNTTFQGKPVPTIEFPMLRNCLTRIARVARDRSLSTGKWFGHDFE